MPQDPYAQLPIITPQAVHDTVLYDGQTRLWFLKLCSLPEIENKLRGSSPSAGAHYSRYRALSLFALILLICAAALFVGAALSSPAQALLLTAAGIMVTGGAMAFLIRRRRPLAELSAELIRLNTSDLPPGMTLYQMSEVFARTYRLPSLVDTIWLWDQGLRNVFLVIYFSTFGVFFLPFWKMILWSALGGSATILGVKAVILMKTNPPRQGVAHQLTTK